MICGAVTNELMKIISSWQEQHSILMNKPRADLGYEIKYGDKLHSISRFGCYPSDHHHHVRERKRGETIRVIEGRVRQIGEKVRDNVERRVRDGTNERQSA